MKTNQYTRRGFTLIELLVVGLIIGILAAVALPQYQKAVKKARLTQVQTGFNAYMKGVDLWLLQNGWPEAFKELPDKLDVNIPCTRIDTELCYLPKGDYFSVWCDASFCTIYYDDGRLDWLHAEIDILKYKDQYNQQWMLYELYMDDQYMDDKKTICQWWAVNYHGLPPVAFFASRVSNSFTVWPR